MSAVLALFRLRLKLLTNRLRVGSRAGRVGMGFLRFCAYLIGFAFLRFGSAVMAETARDAANRFGAEAGVFYFSASLTIASVIIFVVNLLVFAAEEFDTSDTTRDTAFLLSMPLTFRQVVWGKSLLRATVDVYGVFLLGPLLWSLYLVHGGGLPGLALALVTFVLVELTAILAAMVVFVWTAQVVRYDRLEMMRLVLGLILPGLACGAIVMLRHSVNDGSLAVWAGNWNWLVSPLPAGRVVHALVALGAGQVGVAAQAAAAGLGGFALMALACDLAIALPKRALARIQEGSGRTQVTGSAAGWLSRLRSPLALLVAKDLVLLYRRPVFLLTTVLFPLAITGINLLSVVLRAKLQKTGPEVEYLLHASVYVTLLILPFLGAAQSFGQTEHGRIGMLQALPFSMADLMQAKVALFAPLVGGAALTLQLAGEGAFGIWSWQTTPLNLAWTVVASVLATHVAVASAALFPIFEFGVLAIRGANMAIGGMLHFTVTAAVGLLTFPLRLQNKLIALALLVPLVTYLWRNGALRLAYYDEGTVLKKYRDLRWDEAYVLFGLYASLQVVVYVALLFVWDMAPLRAVAWSLDFAALALVGLAAASLYYVSEKAPEARARLGLARGQLARGAGYGLVAGVAILAGLRVLMSLLAPGGSSVLQGVLKESASWHMVFSLTFTAVVIAPVAEELFFRGVLYGAGRATYGAAFGGLASALVFALIHWDRTMPAMFVLGLALNALYAVTGTLYAPIVAHAAFNAAGLAGFALARGAPGGLTMPIYLAVVLVVWPLVLCGVLARLARAHSDHLSSNEGDAARQ